ncbi:hypothetical protein D1007_20997 [Hordeum vulgare]|nr:hypothetical protein D1007_20997 [Hordeum vulgare]KAI4973414.1 hypothetical protein ZWY2020_035675 [Hordeum vulgare]
MEAEEETTTLWEDLAAVEGTTTMLQGEMEEERLTAASRGRRLHAYQQACLHLSIPLPDSDEAEWHGHGDNEGFLEGKGEDREYYDNDG